MPENPYEPPKEVNERPVVVREPHWADGWRIVVVVSLLAVLFAGGFGLFMYVADAMRRP